MSTHEASLTDTFVISLIDDRPCTPALTLPSASVNTVDGYSIDAVEDWIVYSVGAVDDLAITWSGVSNGDCLFTTAVTVNGGASPSWVTHSEAQFSLLSSAVTSKYSVSSDPTTSLSTVGSTDSSLDGVYTVTLIVTDSTNSANTL